MTNLEIVQSVQCESLEHPAVRAWNKLHPRPCRPAAIETLKRNKKSAIYQLTGIGPGGSTIIAKRCQIGTGVTERIIYEQILPRLPLPALRFFGWVESQVAQFCL